MTNKERMLSNKLYKVDDQLRNDARKCRKLVKEYNNLDFDDYQNKEQVLSKLLAKKGKNTYFEAPIFFDYGCHTYIGDNFYANTGCCILDCADVNIGNNVMFGPNVNLFAAYHPIDPTVRISLLELAKQINIGNNVWIGGNTVINPGVTIGDNTVIGSGSVVTKDIPANVVAFGNPCKVYRKINEKDAEYWKEQASNYHREMDK